MALLAVAESDAKYIGMLSNRRKAKTILGKLAEEGMTCILVSHEMGFAREVANNVIFMDEGAIVEVGTPEHFFKNPDHDRTKLFLSQIL